MPKTDPQSPLKLHPSSHLLGPDHQERHEYKVRENHQRSSYEQGSPSTQGDRDMQVAGTAGQVEMALPSRFPTLAHPLDSGSDPHGRERAPKAHSVRNGRRVVAPEESAQAKRRVEP